MKLLLYVAAGFLAMALAVIVITRGQAPASNPLMLFAVGALFVVPPLGAFWMLYMSIRYEKHPLPLVLLALCIPFTFVWYYFERVRAGKLQRDRNFT
jgi:hypothetical protein